MFMNQRSEPVFAGARFGHRYGLLGTPVEFFVVGCEC